MRTLTANTTTKAAQRLASEPVLIIQIDWSSGTVYYGDKTCTVTETIKGALLECGAIQTSGKQDTGGEVSSVSVLLDDTDGTLKTIVNTLVVPGTLVTIYHHYDGNAWTDKTLVFKGKINGTITWDEGVRTLGFDIESFIDDKEVGYAPIKDDLLWQNPDTYGVMWPIVFGGVRKIKAIPVRRGAVGGNTDVILGGWPAYDAAVIKCDEADKYPQDTPIDIVIDMTRFHGYFKDGVFHRDLSNLLWYSDLAIAERDEEDDDYGNKNVCWVAEGVSLYKKQCWNGVANKYQYCWQQEGTKCYFRGAWDTTLDENNTFTEVRGCVHNTWLSDPSMLLHWSIKPSSLMYQYGKPFSDLYIVNEYPSTEVVEVYAWRTYGESEIFVQVPSSYYTVHLSYDFADRHVTAIEFTKPLVEYEHEKWKDDIYVSLRSTLTNNTPNLIKWLIETYTDYDVDATFDTVAINLASFPSNFALFSKKNILALIEEIAWQARCAISVHNGVISIKYLSQDVASVYTITTTDILLKSLKLMFTPIEEIYTKLTGNWKSDYTDTDETNKVLTYTHNVDLYGLKEEEKDIYIYNNENLVKMSLYFWGYRYSNSWRIAEYPTLLRTLAIEMFDCVSHTLTILSTNTIKGLIEDVQHDSNNNEIMLRAQLAARAGLHAYGQPTEDPNYWIGDPAYPVQIIDVPDPLINLSTIDYVVPVVGTNAKTTVTNSTPTEFVYVFFAPTQTEVERAINFPLRIQLQDKKGRRVWTTRQAKLSLHTENSYDKLTGAVIEKTITLTNGEYTGYEQIDGGTSTVDGVYLSCVEMATNLPEGTTYDPGTSIEFSVIAEKVAPLVWETNPPSVVARGVNFPVKITGAFAGNVFNLNLAVAESSKDKVYCNGVHVATITMDGSGEYSATWQILGDTGVDEDVIMVIEDVTQGLFANKASTTFDIGSASSESYVRAMEHTFMLNPVVVGTNNEDVKVNEPVLALTLVSGTMTNLGSIVMGATFKDSDGVLIAHTGDVLFEMQDAIGQWVSFSYPSVGSSFLATMTAGTLPNTTFKPILPTGVNTSPIRVSALVQYESKDYTAYIDMEIDGGVAVITNSFELHKVSGNFENNTTFGLETRIRDTNGNIVATGADATAVVTIDIEDAEGTPISWTSPSVTNTMTKASVAGIMTGDFKVLITPDNVPPATMYASIKGGAFFDTLCLYFTPPEAPVPFDVNVPATAVRGTEFSVTVTALDSGGFPDMDYSTGITITPHSTDNDDAQTPIMINGGDWVNGEVTILFTISGGTGNDTFTFTASSDLEHTVVSDNIAVSPAPTGRFEIVIPEYITRGLEFDVTITALDLADQVDPYYYNEPVTLWFTSSDINDTMLLGDMYIEIWANEWVDGVCTKQITLNGGTGPATVYFEAIDWNEMYGGSDTAQMDAFGYFIVQAPLNIVRAANFMLTVTAYNMDGSIKTNYSPSGVVLTPISTDVADSGTPINITAQTWTNGVCNVTLQVNGGAGTDSIFYSVIDNNNMLGESPAIGIGTTTTVLGAEYWKATFAGSDAFELNYGQNYAAAALAASVVAMQNSTPVISGSSRGESAITLSAGGRDWAYGSDNAGANAGVAVSKYYFSNSQKAGVLSAVLKYYMAGATGRQTMSPWAARPCSQGTVTIRYSDVEPTTYTMLLSGNILGTIGVYGGDCYYGTPSYSLMPDYTGIIYNTTPVYKELPVSIIRNLTGNYLYMWLLHASNVITLGNEPIISGIPVPGTIVGYENCGVASVYLNRLTIEI